MMENLAKLIHECQTRVSHGASCGELVFYLHEQGLTIVESMRVLKETYNLSLGEAKEIVTAHPIWANAVRNADSLHEELEKALRNEAENSRAE